MQTKPHLTSDIWNRFFAFMSSVRKCLGFTAVLGLLIIPSGLYSQQQPIPSVQAAVDTPVTLSRDEPAPQTGQASLSDSSEPPPKPAASNKIAAEDSQRPFHNFILQAAKTYQVDPALIKAIIMAESNYNPLAVSNRGAQGLMQLMPTTAKWLGVEDSFDPALNINGGVRYFRYLLDRFKGDVQLALAAYNAGILHVLKYDGIPPFDATRNYIKKVLEYHQRFQLEMATRGLDSSSV